MTVEITLVVRVVAQLPISPSIDKKMATQLIVEKIKDFKMWPQLDISQVDVFPYESPKLTDGET